MPEGNEVLMELDPVLTKLVKELDPTAEQFVNDKGKLVVRLKRALYGCVQSARLWYEKLRATLISFGFVANPYDPCTFNKMISGHQVTIAFHVDDLLITSVSDDAITVVIQYLKENFQKWGVTLIAT